MSPYIAGRNAALESLRAGIRVRRVLIQEGSNISGALQPILDAATAGGVPVTRVAAAQLEAIHPRHQGVAVEVAPFEYAPFAELTALVREAGPSALVLALDHLQDPQNLGTLLRAALAFGVTGVVIPERREAGITPAVSRASAGAIEHLRVAQVTNLARALSELKAAGLWIVGLDVRGGQPLAEVDLRGPLAIVVGSEGEGLGRLVGERCDFLAHIPMAGTMESLNAAVAGSIALYEVFRRRAESS